MWAVVVALDVGADRLAGLVEGLELLARQIRRSLSFENQDSMNACDSGSR